MPFKPPSCFKNLLSLPFEQNSSTLAMRIRRTCDNTEVAHVLIHVVCLETLKSDVFSRNKLGKHATGYQQVQEATTYIYIYISVTFVDSICFKHGVDVHGPWSLSIYALFWYRTHAPAKCCMIQLAWCCCCVQQ